MRRSSVKEVVLDVRITLFDSAGSVLVEAKARVSVVGSERLDSKSEEWVQAGSSHAVYAPSLPPAVKDAATVAYELHGKTYHWPCVVDALGEGMFSVTRISEPDDKLE